MPRDIYQIGRDAVEFLEKQKQEIAVINSVTLRNIRGKVGIDVWKYLIDHNDLDTRLIDLVVPCQGCPQVFCMETATVEAWEAIDKHYFYCGQSGSCMP